MQTMKQLIAAVAAAGVVAALPVLHAQERLGSGAPTQAAKGAGWTLTPTVGVSESYDDNVSLFGNGTTSPTDDYVSTVFPGADLSYTGRHTRLDVGYGGSFLNYRTFSALNRWDQRAHAEVKREETARLAWFANTSAAMLPSTDLIDFGGIPYRRVGAESYDTRGGISYVLGRRDTITTSLGYQDVAFQNSETFRDFLRGGHILESLTGYRRAVNQRLSAGVDYSFRRASVLGDSEQFNISTIEAAGDYQLSRAWSLSAGLGVVHLQANALADARSGPAMRLTLERHQEGRGFHVGYLRSYIPAFGFGGTTQNQELGVGFSTPLFHSRHFYTDQSVVFRDDSPLSGSLDQLPLRSLRTYSIVGWEPQRWVRFEGFYSRTQQSSLRPGGDVERNRVGFQIVTSKPMRMQ
jgi:hypothetical protein